MYKYTLCCDYIAQLVAPRIGIRRPRPLISDAKHNHRFVIVLYAERCQTNAFSVYPMQSTSKPNHVQLCCMSNAVKPVLFQCILRKTQRNICFFSLCCVPNVVNPLLFKGMECHGEDKNIKNKFEIDLDYLSDITVKVTSKRTRMLLDQDSKWIEGRHIELLNYYENLKFQ